MGLASARPNNNPRARITIEEATQPETRHLIGVAFAHMYSAVAGLVLMHNDNVTVTDDKNSERTD